MNSMRRCKITRIHGGENLREDSIEGWCTSTPEVGKRFGVVSDPLEDGYHVRLITTSPVQEIAGEKRLTSNDFIVARIRTLTGSVYRVEVERLRKSGGNE